MKIFSIITPLYNKENFFRDTVSSVLGQTCADWEWIIVDDGSTDTSSVIAQEAAVKDSRIQYFSQENSGPSTARNHGIKEATGEWLLFLDADDMIEPDYLKKLSEICSDSNVAIHAGGWMEVDPDYGNTVKINWPPSLKEPDPNPKLKDTSIAYAPWHPASAIVRRSILHGTKLWDETMNRLVTEDTVFWWRLIAQYNVSLHPICGVRYRRGTEGCRDQFRNPLKWSEGLFYALQSNIDFWNNLGNRLTAGQVANLVRVYSNFGEEAQKAGADAIDIESYYRADQLLSTGIWLSPAAWCRRLLGSKKFQTWKSKLVS